MIVDFVCTYDRLFSPRWMSALHRPSSRLDTPASAGIIARTFGRLKDLQIHTHREAKTTQYVSTGGRVHARTWL